MVGTTSSLAIESDFVPCTGVAVEPAGLLTLNEIPVSESHAA